MIVVGGVFPGDSKTALGSDVEAAFDGGGDFDDGGDLASMRLDFMMSRLA